MDPLAPSIPISHGIDASVDMDITLNNDLYYWWAEFHVELDDASHDMLFGWIAQDHELLDTALQSQ
jgi:hypothetical protein